MHRLKFVKLLETASSQVVVKKHFVTRFSAYVPDLFFIFSFLTTFIFIAVLERVILYFVIGIENNFQVGIAFILSALSPALYYIILYPCFGPCCCRIKGALDIFTSIIFAFCGLDSIFIFFSVLNVEVREKVTQAHYLSTTELFHIPKKGLSLLKVYCIVYSVCKSIPMMFLTSVLLLIEYSRNKIKVFSLTIFLLMNMVIFSLTIAFTLPIRKNPKIYTSIHGAFLSSINKFLGSLCGCCVTLTTFNALFRNAGYLSFIIQAALTLMCGWPVIFIFTSESFHSEHCLPKFVCGLLLTVIFSFIYIHPFSGKGKLYYYYFYVLKILADIFCIYIFSNTDSTVITSFLSFEFVLIGFVTLFCLINILHRFKMRYRD